MALQVPSGLITSISGGGVTSGTILPMITGPLPVVIVGAAGASASGNLTITTNSGALNVNISGGNLAALMSGVAVSVSGDIVLVVSGGTIQVSGTVGANVSGGITVSGGVTISGGVTVSGNVNVLSGGGPTSVTSGGTLPVSVLSGAQNISGGVTVSGGVTISGGVSVSGFIGAISGGTIPVSIQSSGAAISISGTTVGIYGYAYSLASGATASGGFIINIASGRTVLHTVSMITTTALGFVNIQDALSGNVGNVVANYSGVVAPVTFTYDAVLTSGLQVIVLSGASFAATVTYKNPP